MKDVYYKPHEFKQEEIDLFADHIKPDRTSLDLFFQIVLDLGLPLSVSYTEEIILGKKVFVIPEQNSSKPNVLVCMEKGIDSEFIKEICKLSPAKVVFRDSGFTDDTNKSNVTQILKQLSKETEMVVI